MQDSGHTPEWAGRQVDRVLRNGKRQFAQEFKDWLIEQACTPGVSVAGLALRHGVNANLLRRWVALRRLAGSSQVRMMIPVTVCEAPVPAVPSAEPIASSAAARPAIIEIEFAGGLIRVREDVDCRMLRTVLQALRS